jgi:hypothetical protein
MALILRRAVRPRMQNYQRRRGLGLPPLRTCRGFGAVYVPGQTTPNQVGDTSPDGSSVWDGSHWVSSTPAIPAPVFAPPVQPVNKVCQPWDSACVEGNVAQQVGYQVQVGQAQADYDFQQCLANGTDAGTCRARWPVGYSGDVPILNLTPAQAAGAMQTPAQAAAALQASDAAAAASLLNMAKKVPGGLPPAKASGGSLPVVTTDVLTGGTGTQGSGFSLSSIPWWGWAGAAAVGLYAMRGK